MGRPAGTSPAVYKDAEALHSYYLDPRNEQTQAAAQAALGWTRQQYATRKRVMLREILPDQKEAWSVVLGTVSLVPEHERVWRYMSERLKALATQAETHVVASSEPLDSQRHLTRRSKNLTITLRGLAATCDDLAGQYREAREAAAKVAAK